MKNSWWVGLRILPILLLGCTTSRAIKPLPKGGMEITTTAGGPFISNLGPTIPIPMLSVGGIYGLDGKTNIHGDFFLTGLFAFGVGGVSTGIARELWPAKGGLPRLMVDGTILYFNGDVRPGPPEGGSRFFGDVSAVVSWDLGNHTVFGGLDTFIQPFPGFELNLSPLLGVEFRHQRTAITVEAMWLAPYRNNLPVTASWWGPFHRGALQVQLGLTYDFGAK